MIRIFFKGGEVNDCNSTDNNPFADLKQLLNVQAIAVDGTDLSLLQNNFEGVPFHRTEEPQFFTEDLARYILVNTFPYQGSCTALHALNLEGDEILVWSKQDKLAQTDLNTVFDTEWVKCNFTEISWLLTSYKNLPYHKTNTVQIWVGDIARFIVGQLPAKDGQQ